jgi:hypothetical protein
MRSFYGGKEGDSEGAEGTFYFGAEGLYFWKAKEKQTPQALRLKVWGYKPPRQGRLAFGKDLL